MKINTIYVDWHVGVSNVGINIENDGILLTAVCIVVEWYGYFISMLLVKQQFSSGLVYNFEALELFKIDKSLVELNCKLTMAVKLTK